MLEPRFTDDVADIPTWKFGPSSLTLWGIIGYMVIEGMFFALVIAAYFYLMSQERHWAPDPYLPPDLLAGTLFTIVLLLSEIPNTMIKKAAEAEDVGRVRQLMPWIAAIGLVLLIIRAFEFNSLNVLWSDTAYGSVIWALLFLHTLHIATDWGDTLVLGALLFTKNAGDPRRMVDASENSLYWRFVWLSWLPIYLLIYWLPRWFA
jgi:heme/copper-type cytochrome/quinol oxidase subunit 3